MPESCSTGAECLPQIVCLGPFIADRLPRIVFFVDRLPWAVRQQNVGTHTWDFCVSRGLLRVVTVTRKGDSENVRIRGGFLIAAGGGWKGRGRNPPSVVPPYPSCQAHLPVGWSGRLHASTLAPGIVGTGGGVEGFRASGRFLCMPQIDR